MRRLDGWVIGFFEVEMECELLLSEHVAIMDCDDMANIMLIPCFRPRVDKPEDSCPRNVVDVGILNVVLWP